MANTVEPKLLDAARKGDRDAVEALVIQHQDRIFRFGMTLCRDPEDAKDVLQETLIAMARSIQNFEGRSSLTTWLFTIARNFCIKKRRRSQFAPKTTVSLDTDARGEVRQLRATGPAPDQALEHLELGQAITDAIHTLEPDHREVLVLRDIEGLKAKEVAAVLDISVAAVKSRLHRARVRLREALIPVLEVADDPAPQAGCPDVLTTYSKHLEGEINDELCAKLEQHLATCPRCRGACDSLKHTLRLCRSTPTIDVPKTVQVSVRRALREFLAAS